jgi:hypothetical protein
MNNQPAYRFTTSDKIAALRRELVLRQNVYPRRIGLGKMRQDRASYELAIVQAMIDDYEDRLRVEARPSGKTSPD